MKMFHSLCKSNCCSLSVFEKSFLKVFYLNGSGTVLPQSLKHWRNLSAEFSALEQFKRKRCHLKKANVMFSYLCETGGVVFFSLKPDANIVKERKFVLNIVVLLRCSEVC